MQERKRRAQALGLAALVAAVAALGGCGGGAGGAAGGGQAPGPARIAPGSAPPPGPSPAPAPAPGAQVFYFSDCQAGAEAGCVPGDDANAGTSPSAPKRTLAGFNVNSLAAGSQVLFARGGAWEDFHVVLVNPNATPELPIVLDSYAPAWGGTAKPWMKVSFMVGLEFGEYGDTANDGGYTVRNLKLDGQGASTRGAWLRNTTRNVTLEHLEITGFNVGVYAVNDGPTGNTAFTLRKSHIHHNAEIGFLGAANESSIEGNTFEANNFSGSSLHHGIYLSSSERESRNFTIRGNRLVRNSVVNGACTGGNLTVHGQWDGLVIEGNTIEQTASLGGCYGIAINPAYGSAEYFRNTVVRANTVINLGNVAIGAASAPGVLIENNLVVNTRPTFQFGIVVPERQPGPGDAADTGAIVRNNTIHFSQAGNSSRGIALRNDLGGAGSGLQVVSNLIHFGSGSNSTHFCFEHGALANFAALDHNLCHHAGAGGSWSPAFGTLPQAQAAGADLHGQAGDPLFVTLPAESNGWSDTLQAGSPARDAGHPELSSPKDRLYQLRVVPDIGARE